MEKHNYVYNYAFFGDWMKANPNIKIINFLQMMGMSDYNTVRNWTAGATMLPLNQLMRFCNRFNVPLTAFFYDEFAQEDDAISHIPEQATIAPADGWQNASRKAGIKVSDPRTTEHSTSKLPPYCIKQTSTEDKISKNENISADERLKYLELIGKLNERVLELQQENTKLQVQNVRLKYHKSIHPYKVEEDEYRIVAEDDTGFVTVK